MNKKVAEKKWVYTLYKDEKGYLLKVVCGSSALYFVKLYLNKNEEALYENNADYLDVLASEIRFDPSKFKNRTE